MCRNRSLRKLSPKCHQAYVIETQSELLGILNTRDTDGLVKGLGMMIEQLKTTGSCKPLTGLCSFDKRQIPELFHLWEPVQHDMRLASVPLVLECNAEIIKFLPASDTLLATTFVTIILQEHSKASLQSLVQ